MIKVEEVQARKDATHIYIPESSGEIVEGIHTGNFYKFRDDKRTVTDSDGQKNYAWNMIDYILVKVTEN